MASTTPKTPPRDPVATAAPPVKVDRGALGALGEPAAPVEPVASVPFPPVGAGPTGEVPMGAKVVMKLGAATDEAPGAEEPDAGMTTTALVATA